MRIIAHRGASAERPENTLAAFERAIELGVDAIEADLLVTKDERLVVRHGDLVQRRGSWAYVRELTCDELQAADGDPQQQAPSLEAVFERFADRCPLVLDLKAFGMAQRLAEFLAKRQVPEGLHVTSFLHAEIAEMGRRCPQVARSITLASVPIHLKQVCLHAGTKHVSLYRSYLTEALLERCRREGLRVWAYPVNLPREAETFAAWGVEAIYTDDPAAMQAFRGKSRI